MIKKLNGWIFIDKPPDISSFDVIRIVKKILKINKLGHSGTLAPFATGVLAIALGEATKTIPYLQKCNILVIPLKHESGTRFKIIEAGACKIPCISTKLGAEGLNTSHNEHLLISNEEKEFAKNILDLIDNSDLSDFLSSNLYELVSKNYSLINQEKEGIDILNSI